MDLGLKDKIAFVAGSSRGIGRSIVDALAREGAKVVVTGRETHDLDRAVTELRLQYGDDRVEGCVCDLRNRDVIAGTLADVYARRGRLDIVVANVGSGRGRTGYELSDDEWEAFIETNLMSGIRIVREAVPYLRKSGGGSVVLTASIAGVETLGAPVAYEAAKAALIAAGKNLSRDLARFNIRINCVAPGNILFPGSTWDLKIAEDKEHVLNYLEAQVPMNRLGKPEEIADIVAFLASERASFVTGACIVADGGQTRGF